MSVIDRGSFRLKFSLRYPEFCLCWDLPKMETDAPVVLKHNLVWQLGAKLVRCGPNLFCKRCRSWPILTDLRWLQFSHFAKAIDARGLTELRLTGLIKFEDLLSGMTFGSHCATNYFHKPHVSIEIAANPVG